MGATNEPIQFRLIETPCCHTLLCWVNPRVPNYCPECGKYIFAEMKRDYKPFYTEGWLKVNWSAVDAVPKPSAPGAGRP